MRTGIIGAVDEGGLEERAVEGEGEEEQPLEQGRRFAVAGKCICMAHRLSRSVRE